MMVRLLVAAVGIAVLSPAIARPAPAKVGCHPIGPHAAAEGNLDADRPLEQVVVISGPVDCAHSAFVASLFVEDMCAGVGRRYGVSATNERLDKAEIAEADARPRRHELFYLLHARGLSSGEAAVLHLWPRRRGECPRPRFLFHYRAPAGLSRFDVGLADLTPRFPGQEIRLEERFGSAGDTGARIVTYRFEPKRGVYVPYRGATAVTRAC